MISFTVHSVPVAQPRQRSRVVNAAGRTFTQNYTPTKAPVNAFKAAVQVAAQMNYQGGPLDGPLYVELQFVFPRPQSITKKRGDNPRRWHTKRPDFDNLAKSVCDALSGLMWRDDSQLAHVVIQKIIAMPDEQPFVRIQVVELDCCTSPCGPAV